MTGEALAGAFQALRGAAFQRDDSEGARTAVPRTPHPDEQARAEQSRWAIAWPCMYGDHHVSYAMGGFGVSSLHPALRDAGPPSFNVLLTRRYMALVPRSREAWGPIAVNSMGYAGSLLVRSHAELAFIEAEGPLRILTEVGVPW